MNFDRNTVIGFIILAVLFFAFFWYNNQEEAALQKEMARQEAIKNASNPKTDTVRAKKDSLAADSVKNKVDTTGLGIAIKGTEEKTTIETPLMKVIFSTRGGQPRGVELKKFRAPDSGNVHLASTAFDRISYKVQNGERVLDIADLHFSGGTVVKNGDNTQVVTYSLSAPDGSMLEHQYIIRPDNYMIDFNIRIRNGNRLFPNNTINFTWQNQALQLQKALSYEREQSRISYREDGDYDYSSAASSSSEEFTKPVNWVSVKQQFFNTTLIAKNNFSSGDITWTAPNDEDKKTVVQATAHMKLRYPDSSSADIPLALYYGPTDYKLLKQYGNDMEDMVDLGSGIFAFVKYINRWIIIPVFDLFAQLTTNFGIVILLLTLFIRLLISPLTYSSYLSGAKMKVLRPEIEQLKAKYGQDQQQMSMEQMKLFREAGVNPLGGCIPALLQIPIFFALYSFFNSNVALRDQSFLWADDLSQYDSVFHLPFWIPFYGDHVSMFTITAVVTSFLISIYSMSMTPDQNNPVLKYMPYIFPFILLFIFNRLPAGLTWYYTVSNIITLVLQFVIQNYIINHDKILAKIEANRKKPKTKSKWSERLEQIQEQQKQMRQMQNKNKR